MAILESISTVRNGGRVGSEPREMLKNKTVPKQSRLGFIEEELSQLPVKIKSRFRLNRRWRASSIFIGAKSCGQNDRKENSSCHHFAPMILPIVVWLRVENSI